MCGIFGHTRFGEVQVATSRAALHTLEHRGPDQWGEWIDDRHYVGHRRLSVLDLSEQARQPMADEHGSVVISVNGEIYNYRELRRELEPRYAFRSTGDSEVVLHGYREWGLEGLLQRLEGMFAFAIVDTGRGKICLARDRVGIKPLYFAWHGEFAWASELKALERFFGDRLAVDTTALYDFLTYLYVPTPKTLYRDVFKLRPGHLVEFDVERRCWEERAYWRLQVRREHLDVREAAEGFRELVRQSVERELVSDVPVGFFLSGGIDSSVVVAEASRLSDQVHTYTIGFREKSHDESRFARIVADAFGTRHTQRVLTADDAEVLFGKLKDWYDEPFGDTSALPSHLVASLARETSKVVLTGDGGDEVMGGYLRYRRFARYRRLPVPRLNLFRPLTSAIRRAKKGSLAGRISNRVECAFVADDLELYTRLVGGMLKDEKRAYADLWGIPDDYDDYWCFREHYREDLPVLTRLQFLDLHTYLHDDILTKVDRVTMAVSLEARVPLLWHRLIEFAFSLPEEVRYHGGALKGLMKEAYRTILPAEILGRGKRGFSIPLGSWRQQLLNDGRTREEHILAELFGDRIQVARPETVG